MKIHTVTHKATRRNGKPLKTYKIRYEEVVRDPATGRPTGARRSAPRPTRRMRRPTRDAERSSPSPLPQAR